MQNEATATNCHSEEFTTRNLKRFNYSNGKRPRFLSALRSARNDSHHTALIQ